VSGALDEEVARLHLDKLGVKPRAHAEAGEYIGVSVDGPQAGSTDTETHGSRARQRMNDGAR
jgi:hypothetical protein